MKYTKYGILILSISIFFSGCVVNKNIDNTDNNMIESETNIEKSQSEVVKDSQTIKEEFDKIMTSSCFLMDINSYIKENIEYADKETSDYLIENFIKKLEENQGKEIDLFFENSTIEVQNVLNDIVNKNEIEFYNKSIFSGNSKLAILKYIEKAEYIDLVKNTFSKGYSLYTSEGSYYPVVDYQIIDEEYSKYVSEGMKNYLGLMNNLMNNPTTVEEYLAIEFNELGKRTLKYEEFINNYPEFVFIDEIKSSYMVCLWKLVNPNVFDGTLDERFMLADKTRGIYNDIIDGEDSITKESVNMILLYEKANNGVFGSLQNMEKFMNYSYSVEEDARNLLQIK